MVKFGMVLGAATLLAACGGGDETSAANSDKFDKLFMGDIMNSAGEKIGSLTLQSKPEGTAVITVIDGGTMSVGTHAMHFHEFGKCDGPDYKSAGGHYNPKDTKHGMDMAGGPHAGDMMNFEVEAGDRTNSTVSLVNERVSIEGEGERPALRDGDGSALIIHEKADDGVSQPSGAAGARIACAVIPPL